MYKVLKIQYQKLHSISEDLVRRAVVNGKITAKQYEEIIGNKYIEEGAVD